MEMQVEKFELHRINLEAILEVLNDRKAHYETKRDAFKRQVYHDVRHGISPLNNISSTEYNDGIVSGIRIALDALSKLGSECYITEDGARFLPAEQVYL